MPSLPISKAAPLKRGNQLLDQLPADVYARLTPALREVELKAETVLFAPHVRHMRLYFPSSAVVSVQHDMADGGGGSVAMVGNEGMVGMALLLQTQGTSTRAVVLMQGQALCLEHGAFKREFRRGDAFQRVLLHYIQARIAEMSQVAICNRYHSIEKQLCRWLLLCAARAKTDEILISQEGIARMLGVRREGVTVAARHLQQAGLIRYRHRHIQIIDLEGLQFRSCECYQAILAEYERAMGRSMSLVVV